MALSAPGTLSAATFTVNTTADTVDASIGNGSCADSGGNCSLRAAIQETNALAGADTINFAVAINGTPITLTRIGNDASAVNGDLDVNGSLTITGNGAANTIVQGSANAAFLNSINDKVIGINQDGNFSSLTVGISNLTIRYGHNTIPDPDPLFACTGGGVDVFMTGTGNVITFTNVTITGNENVTSYGGGVNVDSACSNAPAGCGSVTFNSCTISNNTTTGLGGMGAAGGGIYLRHTNGGTVVVDNTAIASNTGVAFGGGICVVLNQTLDVRNNTSISGNSVVAQGTINGFGGGVYVATSGASLTNVTVSNNHADAVGAGPEVAKGGGILVDSGTFTIGAGVVVSGNTSTDGAGIGNRTATSILNVTSPITISGNLASRNGGGLFVENGTVTLNGATFTNNVADNDANSTGDGGAIYRSSGTLNLNGTLAIGSAGSGNRARNGGGIANTAGTLTLNASSSSIVGNQATASGGGVYATGGTVNLTRLPILSNTAATSGGAISVGGATLNAAFNRIAGNTAPSASGLQVSSGTVTAENNWWGCNAGPASAPCDRASGGDTNPWLVLSLTPSAPQTLLVGTVVSPPIGDATPSFTASLRTNSDAVDVSGTNTLPDLTPLTFTQAGGTLANAGSSTSSGRATADWTAGTTPSAGNVSATVDSQTQTTSITIKANTTTVLGVVSPASPTKTNQSVSFPVTVTSNAPAVTPPHPDGTVNISDGTQSCTTASLASGAGNCSIAFATVGTRSVSASYPGSTFFNSSSTAPVSHTVNKADTTATITNAAALNTTPSVVGETFAVNVAVTGEFGNAPTAPTGSVTVTATGGETCTATLAGGTGSCSLTIFTVGSTTLSASYAAGDANFNASPAPATVVHTVNKADSVTTIATDTPDPSVHGGTVTVTINVAALPPGTGTPTGAAFSVTDGSATCNGTLGAGTGSCSLALTGAGPHTLNATWAGNASYNGSTTASGTAHTVSQSPTITTIDSDTADPSVTGEGINVSVTVAPTGGGVGTPGGTVSVSGGGGNCTATLVAGSGSCLVTPTSLGAVTISATYDEASDANFASSSDTESHTINPADTTTTITSDAPDPSGPATPVLVQYGVSVNAPGGGAPTGTVTVSDGVDSCSASVAAGGCTLTLTTGGARTLTATFAPDPGYSGSSDTEGHLVQNPSVTTITSDNPDSSLVGENVTVSVTVSSGAGTPTGSVTVTSDSLESCTIATLSGGAGSCVISFADVGAKTLTASYSGDAGFQPSSGTASHQVMANTTTAILSDNPDPSIAGQSVTVAYSVSHSTGTPAPTGTVTVGDGVDSCNGTVAAGQCSIALSTLGARTLTASYSGDANYHVSSTTASHDVRGATTTTIDSDTPDPSVSGEGVVVTVTVAPVAPAVGTATGTVDVSDGAGTNCTATLSGGTGNCTLTFTTQGAKSISASYLGDASFNGSSAVAAPHTVNKAGTTTTIDATAPASSVTGQSVVVSYTVAASAPATGTPTGNVTVTDGAGGTCTGSVAAGNCTIAFTSAGLRTLTASYAGDANFNASATAAGFAHDVAKADTTTTITADAADPSVTGESITVTFTVTASAPGGGTPTGNVTVSDGAVSCSASVAAGQCGLAPSSAGPKTLSATYAGDADFNGSSGTTTHTVDKAGTTTAITSDDNDPSVSGETVVVNFTVSVNSPGTGTPSGNVTVTDGVSSCTAAIAAGQCSMPIATVGSRTLTATYAGDANFSTSSATAPHVVNKAGTTTTITADAPDPSIVGIPFPVSFAVAPNAPGAGTPTGLVTVTDGASSCSGTVAAGSCSIAIATLGARTLTASYAGDAQFSASVSTGEPHTTMNTAPTASGDLLSTTEDVAGSVSVLTNDNDPDGQPLAVVSFTQGAKGTVACSLAGICTFTPDADLNGGDSFTYTISDGFGGTATATVTVAIAAANDSPVSLADSYSVAENGSLVVAPLGVLANDYDIDGDLLAAELVQPTSHGTLALQASGAFTYDPDPGFSGSDSFSYRAFDGGDQGNTVTVAIEVLEGNGPPVALPDAYSTEQGVTLAIGSPGVLNNDTDEDGDALTASLVTTTTSGALTLAADGSFQYVPDAGFFGSDSFSYHACDPSSCSAGATVTIDVTAADGILTVIGSTSGANGSSFRTSLHLFNDTDQPVDGNLDVIDASAARRVNTLSLQLAPHETRYIEDVMALAGLTGLASANLHMTSGPLPVGVIRVYNDGGELGTSGMLERPVLPSKLLRTGDRAVLIAPADPAATRMNIGVRSLAGGLSLRLALRDAAGGSKTIVERVFAPSTFVQSHASALLGVSPAASDSITIEVLDGSGVVYASATDNQTNDPNIQFAAPVRAASESAAVERVIPVAGSTDGSLGSRFKTAMQIHNAGDAEMTGVLTYHGTDGASATLPLQVRSLETITIDDVLPAMGVSSGLGTLDLTTKGAVDPIAVVRVYSVSEAGESSLTEDLVAPEDALDEGETGTILAPHEIARTRFNIGVRTLNGGAKATVVVRNAAGALLRELQLSWPATHFAQSSAAELLGVTLSGDESVTWTVTDGSAIIYGTWTDNITQDPSLHFATGR